MLASLLCMKYALLLLWRKAKTKNHQTNSLKWYGCLQIDLSCRSNLCTLYTVSYSLFEDISIVYMLSAEAIKPTRYVKNKCSPSAASIRRKQVLHKETNILSILFPHNMIIYTLQSAYLLVCHMFWLIFLFNPKMHLDIYNLKRKKR